MREGVIEPGHERVSGPRIADMMQTLVHYYSNSLSCMV